MAAKKKAKKKKVRKWIKRAIKHPGALHEQLGVPEDKKIPASKVKKAAKKGGKLGQRARLALKMRGFNRKRKKKR